MLNKVKPYAIFNPLYRKTSLVKPHSEVIKIPGFIAAKSMLRTATNNGTKQYKMTPNDKTNEVVPDAMPMMEKLPLELQLAYQQDTKPKARPANMFSPHRVQLVSKIGERQKSKSVNPLFTHPVQWDHSSYYK